MRVRVADWLPQRPEGATLMAMASDDFADALALLRQKRATHLEQLQRIESAINALLGLDQPEQPEPRAAGTRTTREMIVSLADEGDRDWTVREMIDEYAGRGEDFPGANPDSSIRAAIVVAVRKNQIFRTDSGRYKSTKFKPSTPDPSSNGHTSQEAVPFAAYQD